MRKLDAVALGESLIDFTPKGCSEDGMKLFEQNPGGAVANVMAAMAKLGRKTGFIGKVGADMHGDFLTETMQAAGIDTSHVVHDDTVFTTLAFVDLKPDGQREFYFARKPGADTCLKPEEIDADYIASTALLHVGSLSLTDEPARSATLKALEDAKRAGTIVSYDPNYRAMLWKSPEAAMTGMRSVLDQVDLIKISDEETKLLTDCEAPEDAADVLLSKGIKIVTVTLGPDGVLVASKEGKARIPGFRVKAVDTTGAGDSFFGGFLWKLMEFGLGSTKQPQELTLSELREAGQFGNAVASLNVERRGAIPAMPTYEQVMERIERG
ncbi:MAG: carbohydrate kinase [Eubacteriales bacterium]|nr:carbohydrate kinase [Eubacteriales bacterium]